MSTASERSVWHDNVILLNDPSIGDYKATVNEDPGFNFPPQIVHFRESSELVAYGHHVQTMDEKNRQFLLAVTSFNDCIELGNLKIVYYRQLNNFMNHWGHDRVTLGQRRVMNALETDLEINITIFPPQFGVFHGDH